MRIFLFIIFVLIIVLATSGACSISENGSVSSSGFSGIIPGVSSSGGTNSGGSGSGGSSATGSASTKYTTTDNGYFQVSNVTSINLNSNQTFAGLATDSGNLYILLEESEGGGIYHWLFQQEANGQSSFKTVCSILDDGNFNGGLAWDGTYFYTFSKISTTSSVVFRRFPSSTCSEASTLNTSVTPANSSSYQVMSYDSGVLYWETPGSNSYYSNPLELSNSSNGAKINSFTTSLNLGGQTLNLDTLDPFVIKNGILWGFSVNDTHLWKLSISTSSVSAVAWGDTSSATNISGTYFYGMTTQDGNTLILAYGSASNGTSGQLFFNYIDVSHF